MAVLTFSRHGSIPANRAFSVTNGYGSCIAIAATMLAVAMVLVLSPARTGAQGSRVAAALEGAVRDSSGAAISGAAVVVRNVSTNQARDTQTNEEGIFHAE